MTISLRKPLRKGSSEADEFLKRLQGNILRAHGRNHAAHLFISFGSPTDETSLADCVRRAREWIRNQIDGGHITSAWDEEGNTSHVGKFRTLALSSQGYALLGEQRPRDGAFRDGMRDRGDKLNDAKPTTWETAYQYEDHGKHVHALYILADSSADDLNATVASATDELANLGLEVLVSERGNQLLNGDGQPIEHFGYRDGVSQPKFIVPADDDPDTVPDGVEFDQRTPLKRLLEEDRLVNDHYGSFIVYRKLEQDVDSFNAALSRVAGETAQSSDVVGAQAVGRFKNGTPLATSGQPIPGYEASGEGRFGYDDDDDGDKCPLHAHIRKMNPRNSLGFITDIFAREKTRRIARRGITYDSSGRVGLIFISYQSDIKDQFEFMQRRWANGRNFSRFGTGLDPVVGQDGGPQEPSDHPKWPTGYGSGDRKRVAFGEHVRLRGGEYFYAPSMEGLRRLGRNG